MALAVTACGFNQAGYHLKDEVKEMKNLIGSYELTCFDNEGDDGTKESENKQSEEKLFNQEQVNKMMGERTKALNAKLAVAEKNYTELLEQSTLTDAQRQQLQADLEGVQKAMRTKEQQIEFEKQQAQTKFDTELKTAAEERDRYRNMFETSTAQREITDAAMSQEGFNGDDFINWLGPKSKVVEELDANGQKTGRMITQIEWDVENPETGVVERMDKRPAEVVKLMKEDPKGRWANLFVPNVAKGVGAGTAAAQAGGSGKIDVTKLSMEEYMKLRNDPEFKARIGLSQ
jgi:hypothetical protein